MAINLNRSKYGNKKVQVDGKIFDSLKEAMRYNELKMLQDHGKIQDLKCQVKFELQPKFKNEITGKTEKSITYIADFVYYDNEKYEYVIEDVKGFKTEVYKMKRKMMAYKGLYIQEV